MDTRKEALELKVEIQDLLREFTRKTGILVESISVDKRYVWPGQSWSEISDVPKYRVILEMSI